MWLYKKIHIAVSVTHVTRSQRNTQLVSMVFNKQEVFALQYLDFISRCE